MLPKECILVYSSYTVFTNSLNPNNPAKNIKLTEIKNIPEIELYVRHSEFSK